MEGSKKTGYGDWERKSLRGKSVPEQKFKQFKLISHR